MEDLVRLRSHLATTLNLRPSRHVVRVTIFENRQSFDEHIQRNFPELPHRRAFFLKQGDDLLIFACKGASLQADLRHEATHALLNSRLPDVPIWLDEGLAEYCEAWTAEHGVKPENVHRLLAIDAAAALRDWDLRRLESLRSLWQMSAADYRASWLWVHYALHGPADARAELLAHLEALTTGKRDSLADRLAARGLGSPRQLRDHLHEIAGQHLVMADNPLPGSPALK